jgi:hypothetical protein
MIKTKDKFTKDKNKHKKILLTRKYFLYKRKYTKDLKNTKVVKVFKRWLTKDILKKY